MIIITKSPESTLPTYPPHFNLGVIDGLFLIALIYKNKLINKVVISSISEDCWLFRHRVCCVIIGLDKPIVQGKSIQLHDRKSGLDLTSWYQTLGAELTLSE